MEPMIAFHGDKKKKAFYLARIAAHRKADELVRGATGQDGKGCGVWCTLDAYNHERYPVELGVPRELAHLEDRLFEGMPPKKAMLWPTEFLKAIAVGADLSDVWPKFAIWLLKDVRKYARPDGKKAIDAVVSLYRERAPRGDKRWQEAAASASASAASAAASYASYASYAAASYASAAASYAASSASAAASSAAASYAASSASASSASAAASYAAASYASYASYAAASADARSAAFYRQSRKLLDLLRHAKAPKRKAA